MATKKATTNGVHNRVGGLVGGKSGPTTSPPSPDPSGEVEQGSVFEMPGTNLSWLRVVIAGTTEAMTNKMADSQIPQLLSGVIDEPKNKAAKPKSIEEAALRASHIALLRGYGLDAKAANDFYAGHVFGVKGIALKKGAVAAMSALKIKGKVMMMGAFFVHGPFNGLIPVFKSNPPWRPELIGTKGLRDPDELFALASQPVVDVRPIATSGMGGKSGASVSIRPKFDGWFVEVYIGHYGKVIPEKQLLQLVQQAGQSIGVGSYRAERSGDMFGLYRVISAQAMPAGFEPARYKLDPQGRPTK